MPTPPSPEAQGAAPRVYGLVGRSLGHSFSPGYFGSLFRRLGILAQYHRFEMGTLESLRALAEQHPNLAGLNVTLPYKREVIPLLDGLAPTAAATGAVNCIVIEPDGRWIGHNTDAHGFEAALDELLEGAHCPDALLLGGTGGAAAAVRFALQQRPERPNILSVSRAGEDGIRYEALTPAHYERHRLVINATPLGMYPDVETAPPIDYAQLGPDHWLLDLVYNPAETEFLRRGDAQGAHTLNGLPMLHAQAEAAWRLWQAAADPRSR